MAVDHTDPPPGYYDDPSSTKKGNDPPRPEDNKPHSPVSEIRYIYYRPYTVDGGIPSKKQYQGGNPFVGRIKATAVPPHTAGSLKRALVQAEELSDPTGEFTHLFDRESKIAMQAEARVVILTGTVGATPETALGLVFHGKLLHDAATSTFEDIFAGSEPKYLYYRLYTHGGEDTSARAFAKGEPALGRVDRALIAPPRDASSIKRRIAKVEGKPIYIYADLHTAADSPETSDSVLADTFGATAEDPILLVQPERRTGLYNRPLVVVTAPEPRGWSWVPSRWLSPSAGDILRTDGIAHMEEDSRTGWRAYVYTAVDENGRTGWIKIGLTRFLDEPENSGSSCNIQ
ncbi:hypothetical protein B0H11DRAFT_2061516 [Mycena galericulata]|nr:hypothetical protein B0H11DRAFT_2061516 [Mycena galericulata]